MTPSPSIKRSRPSPAKNGDDFTPTIDTEESNGIESSGVIGRNDAEDSYSKSPILATVDEFDTIPASTTFHVQPKTVSSDPFPGKVRNGVFGDASVHSQNQIRNRIPQSRLDTTNGKDLPSSRESAATFLSNVDATPSNVSRMEQKIQSQVEDGSDRYAVKNLVLAAFCAVALASLMYASYLLLGVPPPSSS